MTKFLANAVTVSIDGNSMGQTEAETLPEQVFETVDATGLGDNHEEPLVSPVQKSVEFPVEVFFDRDDADQTAIELLNGVDTAVAVVFGWPFATLDTATLNAKVIGLGSVRVENDTVLKREIMLKTTSKVVWS